MSENATNQSSGQATEVQTQAPTKKNNKGSQFFKKQSRTGPSFKGSVERMNGHVFQTGERPEWGEFQRTLEELQVYCSTTYIQDAGASEPVFSKLENPVLNRPPKPVYSEDNEERSLEEEIYREEVKAFVKAKNSLKNTLHSLFSVIWGQCSQLLRAKLESKSKYKSIKENSDVSGLLK